MLYPFLVLGEQLQGKVGKNIFYNLSRDCILINLYAPAECTVSALYLRLEATDTNIPQMVPLGRGLPGREVPLLDNYGQQVIPDGRSVGEIFLGGVGIFNGYLNNPDETARVLIQLPRKSGVFYRIGDLGMINAQGQIVFVGRVDF